MPPPQQLDLSYLTKESPGFPFGADPSLDPAKQGPIAGAATSTPAQLGGIQLSGLACSDPKTTWESCRLNDLPVDHWIGRVNLFRCLHGQEPGTGAVLMNGGDMEKLDFDEIQTLRFGITPEGGSLQTVLLNGIIVTQATNITPGVRDDPDACYLLDLADKRLLAPQDAAINRAYNIRRQLANTNPPALPAGGEFLRSSMDGSPGPCADPIPWEWLSMLTDIWGMISILGKFPGLPVTPEGRPEGWKFFGMPAYDALGLVLDHLEFALKYNPVTDKFSIIQLGASDTAMVLDLAAQEDNRVWDQEQEGKQAAIGRVPHYVRILFPLEPAPADGESPYWYIDVDDDDATPEESLPGSIVHLHDTMIAYRSNDPDPSVLPANDTELRARADDMAASYFLSLRKGQSNLSRTFAGAQGTAGLLPGSLILGTCWYDRGFGYRTEIVRGPLVRKQLPEAPRGEKVRARITAIGGVLSTTLNGDVTQTATSITVADATPLKTPIPDCPGSPELPIRVRISGERMLVTAIVGPVLTVQRAHCDTWPTEHKSGDVVYLDRPLPCAWHEVSEETDDGWQQKNGGLSGSLTQNPLYERNGRQGMRINDVVLVYRGYVNLNRKQEWVFDFAGPNLQDDSAWSVSTSLGTTMTTGTVLITVSIPNHYPTQGNFYIRIDSEELLVESGAGTATLRVRRGMNGTVPASHAINTPVYWILPSNVRGVDTVTFKDNAFVQPDVPSGTLTDDRFAVHHEVDQWVWVPANAAPDVNGYLKGPAGQNCFLVSKNPTSGKYRKVSAVLLEDPNTRGTE
jgi:hypothetical protein